MGKYLQYILNRDAGQVVRTARGLRQILSYVKSRLGKLSRTRYLWPIRKRLEPIRSWLRGVRKKEPHESKAIKSTTSETADESNSKKAESVNAFEYMSSLLELPPMNAESGPPIVTHCLGALYPGGAERQLCNLAAGIVGRGISTQVVAIHELTGEMGHYAPLLRQAGIEPFTAGARMNPEFETVLERHPEVKKLLEDLPDCLWNAGCIDLFGEFLCSRPHIVHAWMDYCNISGGVAALLAGVPHIILSTRNVNPSHFPYLNMPWFRDGYKLLARSERVHFINNSHAGAADYARWLGLPVDRFHVVLNGVDTSEIRSASPQDVAAFRRELGLTAEHRLLAGVFRFSDEKQPLTFVNVAAQLMHDFPNLHTVIAGGGGMEDEVRRAAKKSGLGNRFHLVGRRDDIPTVLTASEMLMLTSRQEGTPNVLLEAQALCRPVVSTRAGGATDAVDHGNTGFLCEVGDLDQIVARARQILDDTNLRKRLGENGPEFVERQFGLRRMIDETVKLYEDCGLKPADEAVQSA